jgi:hypothetical protein
VTIRETITARWSRSAVDTQRSSRDRFCSHRPQCDGNGRNGATNRPFGHGRRYGNGRRHGCGSRDERRRRHRSACCPRDGAMAMPGGKGEGGGGWSNFGRGSRGRPLCRRQVRYACCVCLRAALTSTSPEDALFCGGCPFAFGCFRSAQAQRLLAQCGNSRLPVEIRQVRINKDPALPAAWGAWVEVA